MIVVALDAIYKNMFVYECLFVSIYYSQRYLFFDSFQQSIQILVRIVINDDSAAPLFVF
jgi:hypothetical protein